MKSFSGGSVPETLNINIPALIISEQGCFYIEGTVFNKNNTLP